MTPAARVQAAIELSAAVEAAEAPADRSVAAYFRSRRYVGSKDRRAISDMLYGVLRARARLDWWLARAGAESGTPRGRVLAWLALADSAGPLDPLFDGSRYGPEPLDAGEAALVQVLSGEALTHPEQPPWVAGEVPLWLYPALHEDLGADFESEMAALSREAPLDLRVNGLKGDRETARRLLAEEGIEAEPTPLSPLGLRLAGRTTLHAARAFREGLVEVQDEGSQLAALLTDARPGMAVADFCAGGGGKTLALAAAMENRGRLLALDRDRKRLDRARPRLARAGVTCATLQALGDHEQAWPGELEAAFDRVLIDAPCSGTGAWRRHPAARWRLAPGALEAMVEAQGRLLERAAPLVRPGGRLAYVTCSLLACENRAPVERFLEGRLDFTSLPVAGVWSAVLGGACPSREPALQLTPARHGTDGFYLALLERREAEG